MGKVDVRIELFIQFYNNFFIGGGTENGSAHSYLLRDTNSLPYIPASTLKGCISQCAASINNFFTDVNLDYLFGKSGNQHGVLYFEHGKLINEKEYAELKSYLTDFSTGVKISRYTKTKRNGQLYTRETSGYGGEMIFQSQVQGFLTDENYQNEITCLVGAIRFLFAIGGGRSAGLGWLKKPIFCKVFIDEEEVSEEKINEWIGGIRCT